MWTQVSGRKRLCYFKNRESLLEMKKLEFNRKKCHQIHCGEKSPVCPVLQVHGEDIELVNEDKYLGDIISDSIQGDGSNSKNIKSRKSKGIGINAQIMQLLQSVTFGYYYCETAFLLRNSILLNGILTNSEVWYSVTKSQIEEL